jgi:predicted transcriptional regulator
MDLKKAGIVSFKKNGRRVDYSLTEKGKKITNLLFSI